MSFLSENLRKLRSEFTSERILNLHVIEKTIKHGKEKFENISTNISNYNT